MQLLDKAIVKDKKINYISAIYEFDNSFVTDEGAWYDAPSSVFANKNNERM